MNQQVMGRGILFIVLKVADRELNKEQTKKW